MKRSFEWFIAYKIAYDREGKKKQLPIVVKIGIVAVALSVCIGIIAIAVGKGLQWEIKEKMATYNGHFQVLNYDNKNSLITLPINESQPFYNDSAYQRFPGLKNVSIFGYVSGILWGKKDFEALVYKGLGPDYRWERFASFLMAGKIPRFSRGNYNDSILISQKISDKLSIDLGDRVKMLFFRNNKKPKLRKFIVAGIFNASFKEFDNNFILGDINHVKKISNWSQGKVGGFEVWVDDWSVLHLVNRAVYKKVGYRLNTQTILEKHPHIIDWISLFDANIVLIIIVMVIIAVVNISAVLLSMILERTQLIGILKTLGAANRSIRKIFILSTSRILIKGGLFGNGLALLLLFLQHYYKIIELDPNYYYVTHVPVRFHIPYFLLFNVACFLFAVLSLWIPSQVISRISPAKSTVM